MKDENARERVRPGTNRGASALRVLHPAGRRLGRRIRGLPSPWAALAICGIALALSPVAHARLTLMHGFADYTSALLWVQTDEPSTVDVSWRTDGETADRHASFEARADNANVVVARLTGLAPGKTVAYIVTGDHDRREGTLRTAPYWAKAEDARDITIAFGSCFFLADPNPIWGGQSYGSGFEIFDAIAAKKPDVMVWMGDNLYYQTPDELDPSMMAFRYRRQRTFGPLQNLLTATSQLALWDDHDYGPNDADLSYVMKGESLTLFKRYWANPSFGLPEVPGVFGYARFGDIDIFLLDDRYYRSANQLLDGPDKTMFGAAQMTWLRSALVYSSAPLKLVVNGTQMWNSANRFEAFGRYATEQKAFARWLVDQRIEGVVFLTGDRHFSELIRIERPGAYPLYEFTSSPLTSRPWDNPPAEERTNPDIVPGTLVFKRQFGMIRVTGPGNDRHLALESYDQKGELQWRQEIRARDLKFPEK